MIGRGAMAEYKMAAENLELYYGNRHVLNNISVGIREKAVTALIGPSGCGKSSFLRCLNRMNDMAEGVSIQGRILLDGEDIYDARTDVTKLRRRVGMVFQQPVPFPMSVYDNVAYGPRIHGIRNRQRLDRIVEEALTGAAIWDEVKDRLGKSALGLSGGQKQRLCIARALAVEPEVILMDEPTSALDPAASFKVEELVRSLKQRYTVVIVTHNMRQAARISDYAVFFLAGEVVEQGVTDSIFTYPADRRTGDYIRGRYG